MPQFTGQSTANTTEKAMDYSTEKKVVQEDQKPDVGEMNFTIRKTAHVVVFAVLALFIYMMIASFKFA
ncbi:hypothetical protein JOC48_000539 [Aquibacillus albus]|uniref:Uncharacterized protein n=1 Tax=Aquibacillus albus TaxID=1168171 RepID=A0ABS2MW33_9BACI|nr:hypothetical protein [Aquibacillus albus]